LRRIELIENALDARMAHEDGASRHAKPLPCRRSSASAIWQPPFCVSATRCWTGLGRASRVAQMVFARTVGDGLGEARGSLTMVGARAPVGVEGLGVRAKLGRRSSRMKVHRRSAPLVDGLVVVAHGAELTGSRASSSMSFAWAGLMS
jgi:hypothetical protein